MKLVAVVLLAGKIVYTDDTQTFDNRRSCIYYAATIHTVEGDDFDCVQHQED